MKKLRVAQIMGGGELGGAENFFYRIFKSLHNSGHTEQKAFIRAFPSRAKDLESYGGKYEGFRFGSAFHWVDRLRYRKSLSLFEPDVVLTWMNRASEYTPKGSYVLVARLGNYYNLKYYQNSDFWIGISRGICDHLVRGGMPIKRVVYIPNFVDEDPVSVPILREEMNSPIGIPIVFANGRLHRNKGFDILLKAMVDVSNAHLWLAGSGPEETRLKTLCRDLGLENRVNFLGWRRDISALLEAADCFVCPSRHEGLGSVVLEAWFRGCPIVATRSQGPSELIDDGETGVLTEIDNPSELAEAIKVLLGQSELRKKLASAGKEAYRSAFSQASITAQYEQFFNAVSSMNSR